MQLYLTKREMEQASIAALPAERQQQIAEIRDSIVLTYDNILDYAQDATHDLTEFSTDLLKTVRTKEIPDVAELVDRLLDNLDSMDASTLSEKRGFLSRLFYGDEVANFTSKYDSVALDIEAVKGKLEETSYQLKKDIEVCNRFLEQNCQYIGNLDNFIMAGKLRISDERAAIAEAEKTLDQLDTMAVQMHMVWKQEVDRLERKLHDLMLMREIAIQNIPQIMLIRDGDGVLVEKIQQSINSAIPLWESQMVIAIQLLRQKGALAVQRNVSRATNSLIEKNSEMLLSGSVEVAKELESGVIDVEVLKKNSESLVQTLNTIKSIREEGKAARLAATRELASLQYKLNEQMMLDSGES